MALTKEPVDEKPKYFDVETYRKIHSETSKSRGRVGRFANRFFGVFDSMQGLFVAMMGLPIMFGMFGAVMLGAYYGPWAFLGIMGSIIGSLAFFVERRVGRSLQFADYNVLRRTLATGIAFLVALGIIFFLLYLGHFGFGPH